MSKMGTLNILRENAIKEARGRLETLIKFHVHREEYYLAAFYLREKWRFLGRWGRS